MFGVFGEGCSCLPMLRSYSIFNQFWKDKEAKHCGNVHTMLCSAVFYWNEMPTAFSRP